MTTDIVPAKGRLLNRWRGPGTGQVLELTRQYLQYAGTLRDADDRAHLGWGSDHALTVATLWAAHACARVPCQDAAHKHEPGVPGGMVWQATPRLGLLSSEPGSGKTYLAEQIMRLVPNPSMQDEPTGPAMARLTGPKHATILLDEGDVLFGAGQRKAMIRSILNNGYRPGGSTSRVWRNDIEEYSTFAPVLVAALDRMQTQTGDDLKALLERFIILPLRKAPDGYRPPRLRREDLQIAATLAKHLQSHMMRHARQLSELAVTAMPAFMSPRQAEIWEALYLVAALAGGEWPQRVADAAEWFAGGAMADAAGESTWQAAEARVRSWQPLGSPA